MTDPVRRPGRLDRDPLSPTVRVVAEPVRELAPSLRSSLRRMLRTYTFAPLTETPIMRDSSLSDTPCATSITTCRSQLERLSPPPAVAVVTRISTVYCVPAVSLHSDASSLLELGQAPSHCGWRDNPKVRSNYLSVLVPGDKASP